MPCCSSCGLPVQGHQILTRPRCSILFNEAIHTSGKEPECTVCLLPWSGHSKGKHIPKDCKFCHQQVQGNPGEDEPEQQEDGDVHARLSCMALENQAIKAQLSQLMELVCQLLPQPGQAPTQPGEEQAASTPPGPSQPASTSSQMVGLPSPTWAQSDVPEGAPGPLQLLPFTHAGQQPAQYLRSPPAGAAG